MSAALPVVTALYAGILGFVGLVLASRVMQRRLEHRIDLGHGGDEEMARTMRVFANFTEYVPMILLLIGFGEMLGAQRWMTHALGAGLVLARLAHAIGFSRSGGASAGRLVGATLTWVALLISSAMLIWLALGRMGPQ